MSVDLVRPALELLLDCAATALDPPAARVVVAPGEMIAWDDCCAGQVWARLISLQPSGRPFPSIDNSQQCGVLLWVATIGVGVLRCAAVVDDAGNAPSAAALTADAWQMTADLNALREAIQCCAAPRLQAAKFGGWAPLGPDGGCVGGEWTLQVAIANCACP